MDHQWFVGLSQVVLEVQCFGNYNTPNRSQGKEPSGPKVISFLLCEWSPEGKKSWRDLFIFGGKLLTVEFWTLFYILSVYSSQKVLDLCKWRQNRDADDAEQHGQIAAESPESQGSLMHLTFQGDFEQLSLIT